MPVYRIAGQAIYFSIPLPELEYYEIAGAGQEIPAFLVDSNIKLTCQATGVVGGEMRRVEVWSGAFGFLLKVAGGGEVCILPDGGAITSVDDSKEVTSLDREIFLGPALVLALALRGVWSLHASASMFRDFLLVFLGESGQGKSTLASYLAGAGGGEWSWVADDILPVTARSRVEAWPHFPQLKVSPIYQPGHSLPEQIPVSRFFLMKNSVGGQPPALKLLSRGRAVQVLAGHTAGARLFDQRLLAGHLAFAAEVAHLVPVYEMTYPRHFAALEDVKELLETPC
jgi:hypothetical protein